MVYVGESLKGDTDIILSSLAINSGRYGNPDKNVMQYVDEELKATPEFQKQLADFQKQLKEGQEFMSSITSVIFKLRDSNEEYDKFVKQKEEGKEFIASKIKEGIPYAEARKQWLETLIPLKQRVDEIALLEAEERKQWLQQREAKLSSLEAEEKTISEAEALIDKQTGKDGQDIGEE